MVVVPNHASHSDSGRTKPANTVGNCPGVKYQDKSTHLLIQIPEHLSKYRNDFFRQRALSGD